MRGRKPAGSFGYIFLKQVIIKKESPNEGTETRTGEAVADQFFI